MTNTPIDLAVGSLHKTRGYGDVVITAYNSSKSVKVMFVDTGYVTTVPSREVRNGLIKDKSVDVTPNEFKAGNVIDSDYGPVEIIKYTNAKHVKVRFIRTSSERVFHANAIRDGRIKDLFAPSVYGVGFIGSGRFNSKAKAYKCWHSMMQRCYDRNFHKANKSYIDCSVEKAWHNFQVFAEWFEQNYPNDVDSFELDKDSKVPGNRVYSPETCLFIPKVLNIKTSAEKSHTLIDPNGNRVDVVNLRGFCKENNLSVQNLYAVRSGKFSHHKGWVLVRLDNKNQ